MEWLSIRLIRVIRSSLIIRHSSFVFRHSFVIRRQSSVNHVEVAKGWGISTIRSCKQKRKG